MEANQQLAELSFLCCIQQNCPTLETVYLGCNFLFFFFTFYKLANCSSLMKRTRPQNLDHIYEALANSGNVGGEDNRNDENKGQIIQTDIKSQDLPEADKLQ